MDGPPQRGWAASHQALVEIEGRAEEGGICFLPTPFLFPGSPFDLAHVALLLPSDCGAHRRVSWVCNVQRQIRDSRTVGADSS